jgi:hypothetical protein
MPRVREVDPCRVLLLVDCVVELAVFMAFFAAYALPRGNMISDTLFTLPVYNVTLTAFLVFRILFGVLFLFGRRLVRPPEHLQARLRRSKQAAWAGFAVTLAGWVWLCWHRDDANHLTGVAVFALGSLTYSLALIRVARLTEGHRLLDAVHMVLEYALIGATASLALTFTVMWALEMPQTFIVEHVAYTLNVAFWLAFFTFHWLEPPRQDPEPGSEMYEMGPVPQCQPLLHVWVQDQGP